MQVVHHLAQDDEPRCSLVLHLPRARREALEVLLDRLDGERDAGIARLQGAGCDRTHARDLVLDGGDRVLDAEAQKRAHADGELGLADRRAFVVDVELQQPPTRCALSLFCVSTSLSPMLAVAFTVPSMVSCVNFTSPLERTLKIPEQVIEKVNESLP